MVRGVRLHVCCAALAAAACDPAEDEPAWNAEPRALVHASLWERADPLRDPMKNHQPEAIQCPDSAMRPEGLGFEVDTGDCNYAHVDQPSLYDVEAGDLLRVRLLHYDLLAADPATAHVAVLIDGQIGWETELAIPSDAAIVDDEVVVDFDAPLGAPVTLHLHNHGYNTYNLLDVEIVSAP